MRKKLSSKTRKRRTTIVRPFYEPPPREIIAEGDLAKMKRVYAQAKEVLEQEADLKRSVKLLGKAIQERERTR